MSNNKKIQTDNSERMDYLFECFRTAREELLFRVRHRDDWLKTQLISQAALLALAKGIEIVGIKSATPYPDLTAFSMSISLIFACLYYTEDNLIGYLSKYIGAISNTEAVLRQEKTIIACSDISEHLRLYARHTLPSRFLAQAFAFIIIPMGLTFYRIVQFKSWGILQFGEVAIDIIFLLFIGIQCFRGFLFRRQTGQLHSKILISPLEYQENIANSPVSSVKDTVETANSTSLIKRLIKTVEISEE